jgi:hypothetical protein
MARNDRADESIGGTGENNDDQAARGLSQRLGHRCACELSFEGKYADSLCGRVTEVELVEERNRTLPERFNSQQLDTCQSVMITGGRGGRR